MKKTNKNYNKFKNKLKEKKKGFTLIELVVVISIILVIVSIAMPKFSGVVKNSKEAADIATAKSIYEAAVLLTTEGTMSKEQFKDGKGGINDLILKKLNSKPVVKSDKQGDFSIDYDSDKEDFVVKIGEEIIYPKKQIKKKQS